MSVLNIKIKLALAVMLAATISAHCADTNLPTSAVENKTGDNTNSVAQYKTEGFLGTWKSEASEGASATMRVTLTLTSDGHFERTGIIASEIKQKFTDQGTWRIDGDRFCTTMTNSTMDVIEKIHESKFKLLSVSKNQFSYKTTKRVYNWTKVN